MALRLLITLLLSSTVALAQTITRVEYFFDTDPGFGNGNSIPITSAATITQGFTVPLGSVTQGFHALYIRAKDNNGLWSIPVIHPVYVQLSAQSASVTPLTRIEYFFDSDPGLGNGLNIPITSAINITQSFTVPLGTVSEGFHALYLRAKDSNGLWSIPVIHPVFVQNNAQSAPTPALKRLEYFIDTDPGLGNGINIPITSAITITQGFTVPLGSVTQGFHALYIRAKDNNGLWSIPVIHPVYVQLSAQSASVTPLTRIEYFFDSDPGLGNGLNIPITSAINITQSFTIPLGTVSEGFHALYLRAKDSNGLWSIPVIHPVFVQNNAQSAPTPALKRLEYFIDTDPGFGNAEQVALSTSNITESIVINLANVTDGFHTLYLRTEDVNGRWSQTLARPFYAQQSGPGTVISAIEYYYDDGITATTAVRYTDFTPAENIDLTFNADLSSLQTSTDYDIYITAIDNNNKRSKSSKLSFTTPVEFCDEVNLPVASGAETCADNTVELSASGATGNEVYVWYASAIDPDPLSITTGNTFITPAINTDTTFYVAIKNGFCIGDRVAIPVRLIFVTAPVVSTSILVNGNQVSLCAGTSITLQAATGFSSYLWSNGETTSSINISSAGIYTLVVRDGAGCFSESSEAFEVIIVPQPCENRPPVITPNLAAANIEGIVSINLNLIVSDPDDNLDITSIRTNSLSSNRGGAASINQNNTLVIDYGGVLITGNDFIGITACDLFNICTQQNIEIEIVGDIEIYNALSPNGDGLNDFLYLRYIEIIPETRNNKVRIFNRWGDVVFEVKNYDNQNNVFNGRNKNGNELPAGTYFFKIDFDSGRASKTGFISLKR